MIEYKNQLRIGAQLRKGTVGQPDLDPTPGYESELDKEIIACAGKYVKGQNLMAFFWAYHCEHSWEDIQLKFFDHLKREVKASTIERYARNAANRIIARFQPS